MTQELMLTLGSMAVGIVVWGVRLEGKVKETASLIALRDKYLDERHTEVKTQLDRMDLKLDRLLNTPS